MAEWTTVFKKLDIQVLVTQSWEFEFRFQIFLVSLFIALIYGYMLCVGKLRRCNLAQTKQVGKQFSHEELSVRQCKSDF